MASKRKTSDETAPDIDYQRAARLLAEGRSREEVEALCPGVDLHHPQIGRDARDVEAAAKVTRTIDPVELKRRLLEIADDDETSVETRVQIYLKLLDH